MQKSMIVVTALALLVLVLTPTSMAQEPVECESDHTVQAGDWLSKIAVEYYDDYGVYPAIVFATNAKSAADASYATIANPNLIMPDWKLCIPSARAALAGLTVNALKNAEYKSDWTKSGTAQLTDGEYREQAAPGSATETVVTLLTDHMAFGQLSDGQEAAAVILITNPGGSGTFRDLAVVAQQGGKPANIAVSFLGDRVKVNSLAIEGGEIVVDMVTQGPDDPFCCPTQQVVQKYALQESELVQTSSEVIGADVHLEGTLWKLVSYLNNQGDLVNVLLNTEISAEFRSGHIAGGAGCNNYTASYRVDGSTIAIGPIAATRMMCADPEGIMEQESGYMVGLESATAYQIEGDKLNMTNDDGVGVATFAVVSE